MDLKKHSHESELAFIGALFCNPIEYVNYGKYVNSFSDFSDEYNRFIYDKFESFYLKYLITSTNLDVCERQFTLFINSDPTSKAMYDSVGGFKFIKRIMALSDARKIHGYYNEMKKYTLIRELYEKSFPIEKLMLHKDFEKLTVEQIIQIMHHNLYNIATTVNNEKGISDLTEGMVDLVEGYCDAPYLGTPYKFDKLTDYFLGMNQGDTLITFGYVNSGKSRKDIAELADLVFIRNKKVLKIDNEMSEIKCKNALITTICNDPAYGYCLNIPERNIKLGIYKDDKEKKAVLDVARMIENKKDRWLFKHMSQYDDLSIEMEIKKGVLSRGVEFVSYGTLKGYGKGMGEWATLKVTMNHLKGLAEDLGIFLSCKAQLDMTSGKLSIFELDESNIGESKGISQICDFSIIDKELSPKDLESAYILNKNGEKLSLPTGDRWNASKVLKNRDGSKPILVQKYDLDLNAWSQYKELYQGF